MKSLLHSGITKTDIQEGTFMPKPRYPKIMIILIGAFVATAVFIPHIVHAQANIQQGLIQGSCLQISTAPCNVQNGVIQLNQAITTIINTFSLIVGIVAVVMLIYGGFRYVTSGGDSSNIGNAKNTIIYAIVGLVIVALSQAIVQFVLTKA